TCGVCWGRERQKSRIVINNAILKNVRRATTNARRTLSIYGNQTQLSEVNFYSDLDGAWITRAVVFAEELSQRRGRAFDRALPQVVCDHGLAVVVEYPGVGIRTDREGRACVDAHELRVVENIEGFESELDPSALFRIADVEVLEDRQVSVVDA